MKMKKFGILCLAFICQIKLAFSACDTTNNATVFTSERAANAVELKFYRVQTDEWTDKGTTNKIAAQLISHATSYCGNNAETCGLQSCCSDPFKEDNVMVSSGYPQNSLKDLLIKISLDFPSTLNSIGNPQCVMGKSALQKIFGEAREDIHTDTGYWITYIDDEFYGIPPPTELNKIIIPIACAVVIGLAILTVVLTFWNKRKEESLRRKKIIEKRKKAKMDKETPVYNVDTKEPRPPSGISGKNDKKQKPKRESEREGSQNRRAVTLKPPVRKDQLYKDNLRQSSHSVKKTSSILSEDSAIKVETTDSRQRQAFSYEKDLDGARGYDGYEKKGYGGYSDQNAPPASHLKPLDSGADEETRSPEKKKKKKKKRSKSKEVMDGMTNEGYTNADEKDAYD